MPILALLLAHAVPLQAWAQDTPPRRDSASSASPANGAVQKPNVPAAPAAGSRLPLFRQLDASLQKVRPPAGGQIRFLVADDFPPFAYRNRNGALTGYAVAVAQAVCRRARVRCQFIVRQQEALTDALRQGQGDVIISGVRPLAANWRKLDFTRPYFMALGRFAVRRDAKLAAASREALTGRRIAVAKGSVHALWLARHMDNARLLLARDFTEAAEHLRQGRVDAVFADWLQLAFWLQGEQAQGCCRALPQLFASRMFAYNHLGMAVPAGRQDLRDFLDRQLDRLQEDGELRILARQFLPLTGEMRAARLGGAEGAAANRGKETNHAGNTNTRPR